MKVAKFLVALATAVLIAVGAAITDDVITPAEWVAIGLAGLGSLGVYAVPNRPQEPDAVRAVRSGRSGV